MDVGVRDLYTPDGWVMPTPQNAITRALHSLLHGVGRMVSSGGPPVFEGPVVFAVSHCHPTRIALYAAAFQGGWRVHFLPSLRDVQQASLKYRPRAVFYEHTCDGVRWDRACAAFAAEHIPFIFKGRRTTDDTFLLLLASGGYYAAGEPLRSEEIVKAVELADELTGLAHVIQ